VVGFTNVEIEYAENTSFYNPYWKLISVLVKPIMGYGNKSDSKKELFVANTSFSFQEASSNIHNHHHHHHYHHHHHHHHRHLLQYLNLTEHLLYNDINK
jgi:hypothetical protein